MHGRKLLNRRRFLLAFVIPGAWFLSIPFLSEEALRALTLAFFIAEVVVAWPLLRYGRIHPALPHLFLGTLILSLCLLITFGEVVWLGWLLVSLMAATALFISGGLIIAFAAVGLAQHEFVSSLLEQWRGWVQEHLFDYPGRCFWTIVTLASLVSRDLALPVAILMIGIQRRTKIEALHLKKADWVKLLIPAIIGGAIPPLLFHLPILLGVDVPSFLSPSHLFGTVWTYWSVAAVIIALASYEYNLPRLSEGLRTIITGTAFGVLLTTLLAYPAYTAIRNYFLPGTAYSGQAHGIAAKLSVMISIIAVISAGPSAILWAKPKKTLGKFVVGALALALAGGMLYVFLGIPLVGVATHSPLYGVAVSRSGYGGDDWILKLALVLNATLAGIPLAGWLFVGGGVFVGGLTGFLAPSLSKSSQQSTTSTFDDVLFDLVGGAAGNFLQITLLAVTITVMITVLAPAVQDQLDSFGVDPLLPSPQWSEAVIIGQPLWVFILYQSLLLWWRHRQNQSLSSRLPQKSHSIVISIFYLVGGASIVLSVVEYLILYKLLPIIVVMVVLGIHIIDGARSLHTELKESGDNNDQNSSVSYPQDIRPWTGSDIVAGLLSGILSYQFIGVAVSMVLIAIELIVDLAAVTAPPPGIELMEKTVSTYFILSSTVGAWLLIAHINLGLSVFNPLYDFLNVNGSKDNRAIKKTPYPIMEKVQFIDISFPLIAGGLLALAAIIAFAFSEYLLGVFFIMGAIPVLIPELIEKASVHWITGTLLSLVALVVYLSLEDVTLTTVLTISSVFFLTRASIGEGYIRRLPRLVLMLSMIFVILPIGLVTFLGLDYYWPLMLIALSLSGLGIAIIYEAFLAYIDNDLQPAFQIVASVGAVLLVSSLFYKPHPISTLGSVSRYDGQHWENLTSGDSTLGDRLRYEFFEDSKERLWYGSGTGAIFRESGEGWRSYQLRSITDVPTRSRVELLSAHLLFAEDQSGRIWVGEGTTFGLFEPAYFSKQDYLHTLDLGIESHITDLVTDASGDLWLTTAGDGVIRVKSSLEIDETDWKSYTKRNSNLPSNDVYSIYADPNGSLWIGLDSTLARFDNEDWTIYSLPDQIVSGELVQTIHIDHKNQLWVGTSRGGYLRSDQRWTPFEEIDGWPNSCSARDDQRQDQDDAFSVRILWEDEQGDLWAGTKCGALRLDGDTWGYVVPDVDVTSFEEDARRAMWIGTKSGLARYDEKTGEVTYFDAENSSLTSDWVRDLHMDSNGQLLVSTFMIEERSSPAWWSTVTLGTLLIGSFLVIVYRAYDLAPETRARQLSQRVIAEPERLYPTVYDLFVDASDAPDVLSQISNDLVRADDPDGARIAIALSMLPSTSDLEKALSQSVSAFADDTTRASAEKLYNLHSLLSETLAAQSIPEIADLELTINPGKEAGTISLHSRVRHIDTLPAFLPEGTTEAWRKIEHVSSILRKYQEVDAATDRLSYLAQALNAIDDAHTATEVVGPPEGPIMVSVVEQWRSAINDAIDTISGRAELRMDLRTTQTHCEEQVTLALRLKNSGRAAAEDIVVTLLPSEGFSSIGERKVYLERLSSGRSVSVEFVIAPVKAGAVRIHCQIEWDDRVAEGHNAEFADILRLYEAPQGFQSIHNPYIVGPPVKSEEMFCGREDVFQFIADNLAGPVQDRTLVLHGQRRTGKTSILYQLLQGRLGKKFIPVLVDMQEIAPLIKSTSDLLGELAYQLARTARKADVNVQEPAMETFDRAPTRSFSRFLDTLEDSLNDRRVLVMFDEFELIEDKIAKGKLDADILGYFRSLMQHRDKLVFIFTGTHRLEEMSHDYWSIFFNIALYRRISFLDHTEAARLIREPVAGNLDIDELAIEKIINLTSGHPYFVQLICWALVNHCNKQQRNYATINDVNAVVQEILMTGEAHFAYIWQHASGVERFALAGLAQTLQPGKAWARPNEILETLSTGGASHIQRATLIDVLDRLEAQEVLEVTGQGSLRYRFQLDVLHLWVKANKSVAAIRERER